MATAVSKAIRLVVVGGVAGGASCAARARRLCERAIITVVERGPHVSFANCGLPYYLGDTITSRNALELHTPQSLSHALNVDVHTNTVVEAVDCRRKTVTLRNTNSGVPSSMPFDKLMLAPGAAPIRPPLPGFDHPRILSLRSLVDTYKIKAVLDLPQTKNVVIVGAGFIGLELAEQLKTKGRHVTVVELANQVLPQADPDMSALLAKELAARSVTLLTGTGVQSFSPLSESATRGKLPADLVLMCVGVRPDTDFLKSSDIKLSASGRVVVNQFQQTSHPDVYAAGDAVETACAIVTGRRVNVALGGPANRQGRVAADHIFRPDVARPYPGSLGTAIVRVFGQTFGMTGLSSRALLEAKVAFKETKVREQHHASYYPGGQDIYAKILWSPENGRLLGAQLVGAEGVDKRTDVFATALRAQMTIDDLVHSELAYAPPFGAAKDLVNIAAFVATNERDGLLETIPDLKSHCDKVSPTKTTLVDVRLTPDPPLTSLPSVQNIDQMNIPHEHIRDEMAHIDPALPTVTICTRGKTAYMAYRVLKQNGYNVVSVGGVAVHHPEYVLPRRSAL